MRGHLISIPFPFFH